VIYPENFEIKTGFDRIRALIIEKCLSPMGHYHTGRMDFIKNKAILLAELDKTSEFQYLLKFEEGFPSDNYFDISVCLEKS